MIHHKIIAQSPAYFSLPHGIEILFSGRELTQIQEYYFSEQSRPSPMDWTFLHVLANHSDSWARPNPAFSHPLLADMFIRDGIKDPVEERIQMMVHLVDLCSEEPSLIQAKDSQGRTALYFTTYAPLVEKLLSLGSHYEDGNAIVSPLHVLASMPQANIEIALAHGADPLRLDHHGRTALHCAVVNPYQEEAVFFLGSVGLEAVNTKDNFGFTPLHYAVLCQNQYAINFLSRLATNETLQDVIAALEQNRLVPQLPQNLSEALHKLKFYDAEYNIPHEFKEYVGLGKKDKINKGKAAYKQDLNQQIVENSQEQAATLAFVKENLPSELAKASASQTVNAMYSPAAKRSDDTFEGKPIYHASSGISGTDKTSTCFFVIGEDGKRNLIAVGQHEGSDAYRISWADENFPVKSGKKYTL